MLPLPSCAASSATYSALPSVFALLAREYPPGRLGKVNAPRLAGPIVLFLKRGEAWASRSNEFVHSPTHVVPGLWARESLPGKGGAVTCVWTIPVERSLRFEAEYSLSEAELPGATFAPAEAATQKNVHLLKGNRSAH